MSSSTIENIDDAHNYKGCVTWLGVCGAPRSGTTVLVKLLNFSQQVGLFSEYGLEHYVRSIDKVFMDWDYSNVPATDMGRDTPAVSAVELTETPKPYFSMVEDFYIQRDSEKLSEERAPKYRSHADQLLLAGYQVVFPDKRLRVVGEKMPLFGQKNDVDWLRQRLKKFRLLAIVRNPLDVVNSSIYRRNKSEQGFDQWHISKIEQAATEWINEWNWISSMRASMNNDIYVIKYEDMVLNSENIMHEVYEFLEIDPIPAKSFEPIPESLRFHALTPVEHARAHNWFHKINQQWSRKSLNDLLDEFPTIPCLLHVSESLDFTVFGNAQNFIRSGFYDPEEAGSWTKGRVAEFSVNLGINRIPCKMKISCHPYHTCRQIDILVNGRAIASHKIPSGDWESRELVSEFVFDPDGGVGMNVQIVIDSPKTNDANNTDSNVDQREIGILINKINFEVG